MPEVVMPKMGDGMEEGTILRWLKREGESVSAGEAIAEIETDKANVEMPAEDAGTLSKIVVPEGQVVPVGTVIAHIGEAPASNGAPLAPVSRPEANASPEPAQVPRAVAGVASGQRVKASPLARKMAAERGIDIASIAGTGPGGRVLGDDVRAALPPAISPESAASPKPAASVLPPTPAVFATPAAPVQQGEETPVSRMRRAIARRTVQSKQTIPHFYLTTPVEMEEALGLLAAFNAEVASNAEKITINDLIVRACAQALGGFPDVNASYTPEDRLRRYTQVNIGIAVGTDEGLTIPVLMNCGAMSLRAISRETKRLIERARAGQLQPAEMSGGAMTVSNLGMFGIEEFGAIINPPESVILAVGAVMPEVLVGEGGAFEARRRMRLTLSCDHRVVDGVLGARFLQEIRRLLEHPFELVS